MYIPKAFAIDDADEMRAFINQRSFATLVVEIDGELTANHLPFVLVCKQGQYRLEGHIAKANLLWHSLQGLSALLIFNGPDGYISPSAYPTKAEHGMVVPTWNYAAVHAYGKVEVIHEQDWLLNQIEQLTNRHEAGMSAPWMVSDAPQTFIEKLCLNLVGISIPIEKMIGKSKASQNQPVANREGVRQYLQTRGRDDLLAWMKPM